MTLTQMPKKDKKAKAAKTKPVEEPIEAELAEPTGWTCPECAYENDADDEECAACGAAKPVVADVEEDGPFKGFKVGLVLSVEEVPKKDKLLECSIDVGGPDETLQRAVLPS